MYHCCIRFYLIGHQPQLYAPLKNVAPLQNFSHEFIESSEPDQLLAEKADVIFLDLREMDIMQAIEEILSGKREDAELILIAESFQLPLSADVLSQVRDVWKAPFAEEELCFRFRRVLEAYREKKDYWQTSQYLETTINSIPNLIWYKSKSGIHEKVNDSFCHTVSKTKEQVQGSTHAYIWNVEQEDPACIESDQKVMSSRRTLVSEETIMTGEGERLLTTYKSPLYDVDGSVMGTVGVAIDITQERAYKQEIVNKNHTLETIFTTLDCGIMCHSLDGSRIISINQAALKILGYETPEEIYEAGFDLVAANVIDGDREKLQESIRTLKKVDDTISVEYQVRHKDGECLHIMGNIKLIEENGELFYRRFLLDCTAQKLREQQERTEKERRQRELIQALSIDYTIVCSFDLDSAKGISLRVADDTDPKIASIFTGDIEFSNSMEEYIEHLVHPDDRDMLRKSCSLENLTQELTDKRTFYINYRVMKGSEETYYQLKAVRAGTWSKSRVVVLGFRNVDDETRKEMKQKNLLMDALSQANRASKAKSVFLSNMSHDIRTPMNAIVGFTTLAITHIDHQEQVLEYLKKILTSGNHLVSLINDVLDMSRIESGKMHLEESLCSLPDILHGLRSIVQADIRAKQMELYIDTVDVLDEDIYCDKLRLNQVLLNLLGNAIKYTGAGGIVSLRITEKPGAPDGFANYEFCIKDTGIGMSKDFVEHIFEPFERERNSTISRIQGTGLGMAITKNIIDMMNGSISVKSEKDVGSEFTVSLTFRLSSDPKEIKAISKLKNCRALVVDDDFNTCDSVSYMLQQIGMRAEWTLSGKEAILRTRQAVMRGDSYSVYVIDWLMPDMNGIEVARRIRKETGDNAPIIVLTAYDWEEIEEEAKEAGVTAFCSKPLFLSELRSCLHSVVGDDEEVPVEKSPKTEIDIPSGRILLAEDNELNQEIAAAILQESGFTIEIANNGQIAVDMLRNSKPGYYKLILMDVQMPVMDGYEATREIRKLENKNLASIPILAMTANAFEEDRRAAIQSGMNGHIAKPIDIEEMLSTLKTVLS